MKIKYWQFIGFFLFCLVFVANADSKKLTGAQIKKLITDAKIVGESYGENFTQTFHQDGNTYYTDSRPSTGRWKVTESQYCSKWGSTLYWGCYDVFVEKKQTRTVIIWVDKNGKKTISYLVAVK